MTVLNIRWKSPVALESQLSNFTPRKFTFEGYMCNSIEGPLQAVKTPQADVQQRICLLPPVQSHRLFKQVIDKDWQSTQKLHWQGVRFERCSAEHYAFMVRLFDAAFLQSESFRTALVDALGKELQHTLGKYDHRKTVLTIPEFLGQLYRLQAALN